MTDKIVSRTDIGQVSPDNALIALEVVRLRLARLWLIGALSIVSILVGQSLLGKYGSNVHEVWGWLLPTIMPTLGMVMAVVGYAALDRSVLSTVVKRPFYEIVMWLSMIYLALVALTILIQPFTRNAPIELMRMSNLWLGPLQGLVGSALAVLFVSKKRRAS